MGVRIQVHLRSISTSFLLLLEDEPDTGWVEEGGRGGGEVVMDGGGSAVRLGWPS